MKNVVCFILGGGKGTRLFPLTRYRSKPAVPLAGKYRLIDIPISNCLNSDINRIYVLTQFLSVSLHRHIRRTYNFDRYHGGFVEILAAQQTMHSNVEESDFTDWYQGTADAVRKNLRYIEQHGNDYVLILSGDQLYRMNFEEMMKSHLDAKADVTIAGLPVTESEASAFGIMQLNDSGRVTGFVEKPQTAKQLDKVRMDPSWLDERGIISRGRGCLASMGIYLFNRDILIELLRSTTHEDFGREVFPKAIEEKHVQMHPFDGFWEDIGTIRSFYESNLALASSNPPFDFTDSDAPIYTRTRFLPPTRALGAQCKNSFVADGCIIGDGVVIENSVIGLRCQIGDNVTIKNSIVMGADFYEKPEQILDAKQDSKPALGIDKGTYIEGAIIDKNARIGENCRIAPNPQLGANFDFEMGVIREGIIAIERGAVLENDWAL